MKWHKRGRGHVKERIKYVWKKGNMRWRIQETMQNKQGKGKTVNL
jgi:hypothetical protein